MNQQQIADSQSGKIPILKELAGDRKTRRLNVMKNGRPKVLILEEISGGRYRDRSKHFFEFDEGGKNLIPVAR